MSLLSLFFRFSRFWCFLLLCRLCLCWRFSILSSLGSPCSSRRCINSVDDSLSVSARPTRWAIAVSCDLEGILLVERCADMLICLFPECKWLCSSDSIFLILPYISLARFCHASPCILFVPRGIRKCENAQQLQKICKAYCYILSLKIYSGAMFMYGT